LSDSDCVRCGKRWPGDGHPDALDWEALVDGDGEVIGQICEDCITPDERQAIDHEDMELLDHIEGGRLIAEALGEEYNP
jgi:hypothetical protein